MGWLWVKTYPQLYVEGGPNPVEAERSGVILRIHVFSSKEIPLQEGGAPKGWGDVEKNNVLLYSVCMNFVIDLYE